jgi:hypothetical protein
MKRIEGTGAGEAAADVEFEGISSKNIIETLI